MALMDASTLAVRRVTFEGFSIRESTVYEAAANLRKTRDIEAAVAALAALAPAAEDFVGRFQRVSVSPIATARYLLREIEHAKRRTTGGRSRGDRSRPRRAHLPANARQREVAEPRTGNQQTRQPDPAR
jgi:hypothetical protein